MDLTNVAVFVPIVSIVGGICVAITAILSKAKLRELRVRERIAMIEKGLVPSPEVDPAGFDRVMGRLERRETHPGGKHRRVGITIIGVGLGLTVLIALTGDTVREALGVGGFFVILGLAFLINSFFESPRSNGGAPVPPGSPTPDIRTPPRR